MILRLFEKIDKFEPEESHRKTYLTTEHNYAGLYGGAIFHVDSPSTQQCSTIGYDLEKYKKLPYCFYQIDGYLGMDEDKRSPKNLQYISIFSKNDTASKSGHYLFGGFLNLCRFRTELFFEGVDFIEKVGHIYPQRREGKLITSEAYDLLFCNEDKHRSVLLYTGQTFNISLFAAALPSVGTCCC